MKEIWGSHTFLCSIISKTQITYFYSQTISTWPTYYSQDNDQIKGSIL